MSKTVSFVARDELAEWLESQAEAEMKSVSAVCQDIVAKEYRAQSGENTAKSGDRGRGERKDVFERNPDAWYVPNSTAERNYAVRVPPDAGVTDAGDPRYYKTKQGAAQGLRRFYE